MFLIMPLLFGAVFFSGVGRIQPVNDKALDPSCISSTSKVDCLHDKNIVRWIK